MAENTPQVSGKVKAGSVAATAASFLVSTVLTYAAEHAPALEPMFSNAVVQGGTVAVLTGLFTFASGYIARHLPSELKQDIADAWSAEANDENRSADDE